jgi:ankyrin repeat protein
MTALILSADMGHVKRVDYRRRRRADVNAKDHYNMTALHYAGGGGHLDIVITG